MGKPTEAASDERGTTATVLQFPALVTAPVENIRWYGRYPRGVVSFTRARLSRAARAWEAQRLAEQDRIRRLRAEYLAKMAKSFDDFLLEGEDEQ